MSSTVPTGGKVRGGREERALYAPGTVEHRHRMSATLCPATPMSASSMLASSSVAGLCGMPKTLND